MATNENQPQQETYMAGKLRTQTGDLYKYTRITTVIAGHALAGLATGGWSIIFTALTCARTLFNATDSNLFFSPDHVLSGDYLATHLATEKSKGSPHPKSNAILSGIKDGLASTFIKPLAWALMAATATIDAIGHTGQALHAATIAITRGSDEALEKASPHRFFSKTNSLRDVFWRVGAITPSKYDSDVIMNNSTLPIEEKLHEQRKNARGHMRWES